LPRLDASAGVSRRALPLAGDRVGSASSAAACPAISRMPSRSLSDAALEEPCAAATRPESADARSPTTLPEAAIGREPDRGHGLDRDRRRSPPIGPDLLSMTKSTPRAPRAQHPFPFVERPDAISEPARLLCGGIGLNRGGSPPGTRARLSCCPAADAGRAAEGERLAQ
jgi:hypothetical protein